MPARNRALPGQPSLRYLKLAAKRRLAVGEFASLHDAQLAVAREHGHPSWAALKQFVASPSAAANPALAQLQWMIARFRDAGEQGWAVPGEDELRQHFDDQFLAAIPPDVLVRTITSVAAALREELVVASQTSLVVRVQIGGLDVAAAAAADPPHKLTGLRGFPLGKLIADPRTGLPPTDSSGAPPDWAAELAGWAFGELGLAGLLLAGNGPGGTPWVTATGWADLDRGEVLQPSHRFPASGIASLVTTTAVLRLVAAGQIGLDWPANDYLRTVRLADDTVTVRELLSSTGGVDNPAGGTLIADRVPELVTVTGPVIGCGGPRGVVWPSNGGFAVLGQLVADVTGSSFREAAGRLVLGPLGMRDSSFPASAAEFGPRAVTGYRVTAEGAFAPVPAKVCTLPAAGGLWATPADLLRLGTGWASLLPDSMASHAVAPAPAADGGELRAGLGWLLSPRGDVAMTGGVFPGSAAALLLRIRDGQVHISLTNRLIAVDRVNDGVLRAWAKTAR
jgi:CubicO group peptidase (beta-lactamase class C family)